MLIVQHDEPSGTGDPGGIVNLDPVLAVAAPCLVSVGVGAGSALVPLINAEAYVLAAALRLARPQLVLVVLALALGQTAGKVAFFEAARRGSTWFDRHRRPEKDHRWARRIQGALASSRTGVPLVLTSAVVGLPPLAVVSLAAGAAGQVRWHFALACLVGRSVRFTAVGFSLAYAFS